jgi:hypothetical protein
MAEHVEADGRHAGLSARLIEYAPAVVRFVEPVGSKTLILAPAGVRRIGDVFWILVHLLVGRFLRDQLDAGASRCSFSAAVGNVAV